MSGRLRVAMLIQAYHPHVGGAERQLKALTPRLQRQGVDVSILTRRFPGMKPFERIEDVPVYRLPVPGPKALASLSFTLNALWLLRRLQPDLIHAHELLSPTTTALAAKRAYNLPVVAKVLRGGVLGDVAKLKSRKSGQRRIDLMKQNVDAFITISREIDQELEDLGVDVAKRVFIPNGVDIQRFQPALAAEKPSLRSRLGISGEPVAVFAGRFVPEKRIDFLVDSWPAVRECHPGAELVLLGDGPEMDGLKARAGQGVTFAGQVDDVRPYLQAADLFVLPSSTEGLSNSLLEGMAMGLPCLATRVGGASDLIEHGTNGWLVPPEDRLALESGLIHLFALDEARQRMGEEARKKVLNEYALDRVADRLCGLYAGLTSVQLPAKAAKI